MDVLFHKHSSSPSPSPHPHPHPHHHEHIIVHESSAWVTGVYHTWFWVLGAAAIICLVGLMQPSKGAKRASYYLSFAINATAAMAYFAMAHGQGRSLVLQNGGLFEVFWARYVDWSITTPLLLAHLILFAGLAWQQIAFIMLSDVGMIVTGLIGNLDPGSTKWGWFIFGCIFQIIIAVELFGPAKANAKAKGANQHKIYMMALTYLIVIWAVYPVVWALEHGTGIISVSTAGLTYAILDFLAKPLFSLFLFFLHAHLENGTDPIETTTGLLESATGEA